MGLQLEGPSWSHPRGMAWQWPRVGGRQCRWQELNGGEWGSCRLQWGELKCRG